MNISTPIKSVDSIVTITESLKGENRLLFIMGINLGAHLGGLLKLRVGDVFNEDGTIKEKISIYEQQTAWSVLQPKTYYLNMAVARALKKYLSKEAMTMECRLFKDKPTTTYERVLREAIQNELGPDFYVDTHTLRKTYGYHIIHSAPDTYEAITIVQKMFGHNSPDTTMRYLGIA